MTSNMVAVPRSRHASLDPARLFFVSLCLQLLLTQKELSMCSRSLVTASVTATIEVLDLVVFLVCTLVLKVLAVDFLSSLCLGDIACEPGNFLRKLLFRIYDRQLPISVSDRSHPVFLELSYFIAEKVP